MMASAQAILVEPTASVAASAELDEGAQVFAQAVVGSAARVGRGVIVNSGAIVSHDCDIGACTHIAPGAVLAGEVTVGESVLVGMGVTAAVGVRIGDGAIVGNGTVLRGDEPVADAHLVFMARAAEQTMDLSGFRMSASDSSGRYEVGLSVPGAYQVMVSPGGGAVEQIAVSIEVPDAPEAQLDIRIPHNGIGGLITDADGQPIVMNAEKVGKLRRYVGLVDGVRQIGVMLGFGPLDGAHYE